MKENKLTQEMRDYIESSYMKDYIESTYIQSPPKLTIDIGNGQVRKTYQEGFTVDGVSFVCELYWEGKDDGEDSGEWILPEVGDYVFLNDGQD